MTIFIGGTYSSNTAKTRQLFGGDQGMMAWQHTVQDVNAVGRLNGAGVVPWDGGNNDESRGSGALNLAAAYRKWLSNSFKDETCTIIGFSHGGNIAIMALKQLAGQNMLIASDVRLVTLATPAFEEYVEAASVVGEHNNVLWYNVYDPNDAVQGRFSGIKINDDFYKGGRSYGRSFDIEVDTGGNAFTAHRLTACGPKSRLELAKKWRA